MSIHEQSRLRKPQDAANQSDTEFFNSLVQKHVLAPIEEAKIILSVCESPIEWRLGWAIFFEYALRGTIDFRSADTPEELANVFPAHPFAIAPQVDIEDYRVDFLAIGRDGYRLVIECDGHEFHEKTKEQAARDKLRERALVCMGYTIYRFTGSEIWRDPGGCATQVINAMWMNERLNK